MLTLITITNPLRINVSNECTVYEPGFVKCSHSVKETNLTFNIKPDHRTYNTQHVNNHL